MTAEKLKRYKSICNEIKKIKSSQEYLNLLLLETEKKEIEDFIKNIDDCQTRKIFEMKYIQECQWYKIAIKLGGGNTESSCRMRVKRYLLKK